MSDPSQNSHHGDEETVLTANERTVLKGYQECRQECRDGLGNFKWAMGNLSTEQRYGVWALMSYLQRCWELIQLDQPEECEAVFKKWRQENSDWFEGKFRSGRLVALSDTAARFKIPQEYLVEMLSAIEAWLESRQFADKQAMDAFAGRLGGTAMSCLMVVLGNDHEPHASDNEAAADAPPEILGLPNAKAYPRLYRAAVDIGRSLVKTFLLTRLASNLKRGRVFLPQDELNKRHCRIGDLCLGKADSGFCNLVAKQAQECRQDLLDASHNLDELSFDGKRVMKSVLSMALKLLDKVESQPDAVLRRPIELTAGEQFKFQLKHVLGMEGNQELAHLSAAH